MDEYYDCEHEDWDAVFCWNCGAFQGEFCLLCGSDVTPDYMCGGVRECDCDPPPPRKEEWE